MTTPSSRDRVLEFLSIWTAADADRIGARLDPDVIFESPIQNLSGREAVVAAMTEFARAVERVDVLAAGSDGDEVVVMYDMHTAPFGTIRAAEHYTLRDGLIVSDHLVFDTSALSQGRRA